MKIALSSDHAGFALKDELVNELRSEGYTVTDLGTDSAEVSTDYPDYAERLGLAIQSGEAERGIMVCGSGVGAGIALNKMPGVRASVCHDTYSAHQGVEHDDMNALCLGGRVIGGEPAREIVRAFLKASFSGEERHVRRLNKVNAIEARYSKTE